jgi:hypothetical protein
MNRRIFLTCLTMAGTSTGASAQVVLPAPSPTWDFERAVADFVKRWNDWVKNANTINDQKVCKGLSKAFRKVEQLGYFPPIRESA